jgi:hypothetical protein
MGSALFAPFPNDICAKNSAGVNGELRGISHIHGHGSEDPQWSQQKVGWIEQPMWTKVYIVNKTKQLNNRVGILMDNYE